jgi:hypothetical protein
MANLDGIGTSQQPPPAMFGCQLFREGAFCSVECFTACNWSARVFGKSFRPPARSNVGFFRLRLNIGNCG